jgi:hypothetical protein
MEFNNKHIVFIILIVINIIFIFNYDVYIIKKDQEICKPIYITKRELPEQIDMTNQNDDKTEKFNNLDDDNKSYPNKIIIPDIENKYKKKVISNVIDVLINAPTNFSNNIIQKLINHFSNIYRKF